MNQTIYYPVGGEQTTPYPVGSVYQSTDSTSPASLFGGTWSEINDVFLLGSDATYTAGSTGGAATVQITTPTMAGHSHQLQNNWPGGSSGGSNTCYSATYKGGSLQYSGYTGGGGAHNNMPPYTVIYMWERTA